MNNHEQQTDSTGTGNLEPNPQKSPRSKGAQAEAGIADQTKDGPLLIVEVFGQPFLFAKAGGWIPLTDKLLKELRIIVARKVTKNL